MTAPAPQYSEMLRETSAIRATPPHQNWLRCVDCEYDLRGLPTDGSCPECGNSVRDSLEARGTLTLRRLRSSRDACVLFVLAAAISVASHFLARRIRPSDPIVRTYTARELKSIAWSLGPPLLCLLATWMLTRRSRRRPRAAESIGRVFVRYVALIGVIPQVTMVLFFRYVTSGPADLYFTRGIPTVVCVTVTLAIATILIRRAVVHRWYLLAALTLLVTAVALPSYLQCGVTELGPQIATAARDPTLKAVPLPLVGYPYAVWWMMRWSMNFETTVPAWDRATTGAIASSWAFIFLLTAFAYRFDEAAAIVKKQLDGIPAEPRGASAADASQSSDANSQT